MRLEEIRIRNYRSIEDVTVRFPSNCPVILFGQNNAGKSNILSAINTFLGEKFPLYQDIADSDYREGNREPIDITGTFDENVPGVRPFLPQFWDTSKTVTINSNSILTAPPIYNANSQCHNGLPTSNINIKKIALRYQKYTHNGIPYPERYFYSPDNSHLMINIEENAWRDYSSLLISANKGLRSALDHGNKNSIIRKLFSKIFNQNELESLKEKLDEAKKELPEKGRIRIVMGDLLSMVNNHIDGFSALDFALYNPEDLSDAIHFVVKEGCESIYDLGEGEQQILTLSLLIAYAKYAGGFRVLLVDEPETHLHLLAQKWLKGYIKKRLKCPISDMGDKLQFVIATHSPYFLDPDFIEGFVHVYKESGVTCAKQPSLTDLCKTVQKKKKKKDMTKEELIAYLHVIFTDKQLRGFFAKMVMLVEGESEVETLPIYFANQDFPLYEEGIDIISCDGKENIGTFYKIFEAYGYKCYAIFDYDEGNDKGESVDKQLIPLTRYKGELPSKENERKRYFVGENCAFFRSDLDVYIHEYLTEELKEKYEDIRDKLAEVYDFKTWHYDNEKGPEQKPKYERAWAVYITEKEPAIIIPFVEDVKSQLKIKTEAMRETEEYGKSDKACDTQFRI